MFLIVRVTLPSKNHQVTSQTICSPRPAPLSLRLLVIQHFLQESLKEPIVAFAVLNGALQWCRAGLLLMSAPQISLKSAYLPTLPAFLHNHLIPGIWKKLLQFSSNLLTPILSVLMLVQAQTMTSTPQCYMTNSNYKMTSVIRHGPISRY